MFFKKVLLADRCICLLQNCSAYVVRCCLPSVCLSVCLFVCSIRRRMYCDKTAESKIMPFSLKCLYASKVVAVFVVVIVVVV